SQRMSVLPLLIIEPISFQVPRKFPDNSLNFSLKKAFSALSRIVFSLLRYLVYSFLLSGVFVLRYFLYSLDFFIQHLTNQFHYPLFPVWRGWTVPMNASSPLEVIVAFMV